MIYLPPPQPNLNQEIRISGDVEIHPTASLASGVILQAAPDSRIVIGADVCIGMGAIITAHQGSVKIGDGAILGAGVLIIGQSQIGNNSCIGTSSTIFQQNIASMTVIEPGSIIGDPSRSIELKEETEHKIQDQPPQSNKHNLNGKSVIDSVEEIQDLTSTITEEEKTPESGSKPQVKTVGEQSLSGSKPPVVGQLYINELLVTLFPHKKDSDPD